MKTEVIRSVAEKYMDEKSSLELARNIAMWYPPDVTNPIESISDAIRRRFLMGLEIRGDEIDLISDLVLAWRRHCAGE